MNSFGHIFRITAFGESHGPALGGVIDGMPSGIAIDIDRVQHELDRRRPGQSDIVTSRNEPDRLQILSGLFEGQTTGTPIGFIIENANQRPADYEEMRHVFRPSHADYTYSLKYGIRDHRGGGRSSARTTAPIVAAGAFARQALEREGVQVCAYTSQVGDIKADTVKALDNLGGIDANAVRCPDTEAAAKMEDLIRTVKADGDTIGGIVTGIIKGCPAGLGEPIFDKLQARLAAAMMSINAAKGFDYGMGFEGCSQRGSLMNDRFASDGDRVTTLTNNSGGIQGGISNGRDIYFRVAFKPVATLLQPIETVNDAMESTVLKARGRHDPCVLPRAVPIVEAMACIVLLDSLLMARTSGHII